VTAHKLERVPEMFEERKNKETPQCQSKGPGLDIWHLVIQKFTMQQTENKVAA